MSRVIVIDPIQERIFETSAETLEECQKIVGGYIERAFILADNGDELFCNEEFLLTDKNHFFSFSGGAIVLGGVAYVTGATDDDGGDTDAKSTLKEIRDSVVWLGERACE